MLITATLAVYFTIDAFDLRWKDCEKVLVLVLLATFGCICVSFLRSQVVFAWPVAWPAGAERERLVACATRGLVRARCWEWSRVALEE